MHDGPNRRLTPLFQQTTQLSSRSAKAGRRRKVRSSECGMLKTTRGSNGMTLRTYEAKVLKPQDEYAYRAAGFLPYRLDADGNVEVLVGVERYRERGLKWSFLGGRREKGDDGSFATAVRELWEETGREMDLDVITKTIQTSTDLRVFWLPSGKYALFLCGVSSLSGWSKNISERYNEMPRSERPDEADMASLHWLPLQYVSKFFAEGSYVPPDYTPPPEPDCLPLKLNYANVRPPMSQILLSVAFWRCLFQSVSEHERRRSFPFPHALGFDTSVFKRLFSDLLPRPSLARREDLRRPKATGTAPAAARRPDRAIKVPPLATGQRRHNLTEASVDLTALTKAEGEPAVVGERADASGAGGSFVSVTSIRQLLLATSVAMAEGSRRSTVPLTQPAPRPAEPPPSNATGGGAAAAARVTVVDLRSKLTLPNQSRVNATFFTQASPPRNTTSDQSTLNDTALAVPTTRPPRARRRRGRRGRGGKGALELPNQSRVNVTAFTGSTPRDVTPPLDGESSDPGQRSVGVMADDVSPHTVMDPHDDLWEHAEVDIIHDMLAVDSADGTSTSADFDRDGPHTALNRRNGARRKRKTYNLRLGVGGGAASADGRPVTRDKADGEGELVRVRPRK
ncbi:unnamed protein product [Vitrella brassicaformis CCMP3155]|uniref:Nudix hydrolase domain-containing protein n=3 Tax=Vitrella brassicaformis TaxID=1169539 RepID=A0A0G4GWK5_VITBC|nr:unnamed protein product [Vitrella brassicaformis CCMP3155]|eukprot:CEM35384.1 unnamed protein product [Vitrella brassicaformis CCMP3155]